MSDLVSPLPEYMTSPLRRLACKWQHPQQKTRNQSRAKRDSQANQLRNGNLGKPETRNLRPLLFLAALVGLTSCIGVGQAVVTHRVYGTVVDAATHRPIANARVALQEYPKIAAATSADGAFNIPSQRALRVQLPIEAQHHADQPAIVVTAPGYRPVTVTTFNDHHEIALTRE